MVYKTEKFCILSPNKALGHLYMLQMCFMFCYVAAGTVDGQLRSKKKNEEQNRIHRRTGEKLLLRDTCTMVIQSFACKHRSLSHSMRCARISIITFSVQNANDIDEPHILDISHFFHRDELILHGRPPWRHRSHVSTSEHKKCCPKFVKHKKTSRKKI